MFDVNGILDALKNDPQTRKTAAVGAGAGAAGLAAGLLMGKSGRKMLKKTAKYGAVAAIGGLAYHAWTKSREPQAPTTAPVPAPQSSDYEAAPEQTAFLPAPGDEAAQDDLGKTLVRAMIAAAKADGKIDADEKEQIFARLNDMPLDAEAKAFVFDELSAPLDIDRVVAGARTPEQAAEVYAASLVAIEADTAAEKAYLQMLAARLNLDEAFVREVHASADAAAPA